MAGFGGIGFCCCGPCPCAVSDDFAVDSIADYDVTGTFAVAGGVLTASTAGTATQTLKLPSPGSTRAAGVSADVTNNSHALFGLVIGEGANRIEWLWDVANTQCTLLVYSGGVAIVDADYAGAPSTSLEVQIVPNDCSWDITVYRDGVLVATHTDIAVTFDADWTAFGVTANDASGGTWDNLCLRSCTDPCEIVACGGLTLPAFFKGTFSGFSANVDFDGSGRPQDTSCCDVFNRDWLLANSKHAFNAKVSCPDPIGDCCGEAMAGAASCFYYAVSAEPWYDSGTDYPQCGGRTWQSPIQKSGEGWQRVSTEFIDSVASPCGVTHFDRDSQPSAEPIPSAATPAVRLFFSVSGSPGSWTLSAEVQVTLLSVGLFGIYEYFERFTYSGAIGDDLNVSEYGPIVLTAQNDPYSSTADSEGDMPCNVPSTITIEPVSESEIVSTGILGGMSPCDDLFSCDALFSTHGLLSLDGSIGGDEFRVCLSGPAGFSNGPFTGTINGETQGMTGDCATATIDVSLECKRVCEHQYAWVLVLDDGTNVAEIVYEPAAAPTVGDVISGTITLCGGSQAFAALLSDFDGSDNPVSLLCPDLDPGELCTASINKATGSFNPGAECECGTNANGAAYSESDLTCTTSSASLSSLIGYDLTGGYWIADFPIVGLTNEWAGWKTLLYNNGGTITSIVIDDDNCPQWSPVSSSIDCSTLTFVFEYDEPIDASCCTIPVGNAIVTWGP